MYKYYFFFLALFSLSCSRAELHIAEPHIQKSRAIADASLFFKNKGFCVFHKGKDFSVNRYDVDKELRGISKKKLEAFLKAGYLRLGQLSNGDYTICAHTRGLGGGPVGATVGVVIGKAATHAVCHGAIHAVSWASNLVVPGSGIPVCAGLEGVLAGPIEGLSVKVAVACGIALGSATGPV